MSTHMRDAARDAAFGYEPERELAQTEPDGDYCPRCSGDGWIENGDGYDECTCGEASS